MKTYVLTVSEKFMKGHPKEGQDTGFINAILKGRKIHTIREDKRGEWMRRIKEVQEGNAVISVRVWTDKAYQSKQREIAVFGKDDGVGFERIRMNYPVISLTPEDKDKNALTHIIARNDGLTHRDLWDWFGKTGGLRVVTIIHFTEMRYADRVLENEIDLG